MNSSGVLYETPRLFLTTDASASIALLCRGVRFASGVKWCQNKTYHVRRAAPKNDGEAADRGGKMLQPSLIHQHVISIVVATAASYQHRRFFGLRVDHVPEFLRVRLIVCTRVALCKMHCEQRTLTGSHMRVHTHTL